MADRIRNHRPRGPAKRITDRQGYFYPGEVARILGLGDIDYAQLRQLLRLVRPDTEQPGRAWARYNLRDLACLRVALELAGGTDALRKGRRLHLRRLRRAYDTLQKAGYALPLLDVDLSRDGSRIVANASGIRFDAESGQLYLDLVQRDTQTFLADNVVRPVFRSVSLAMGRERQALRSRSLRSSVLWRVAIQAQSAEAIQ